MNMNVNTDEGVFTVVLITMYLCSIILFSIAYGASKRPFQATMWKLNEKSAVKVTGKIIESRVFESEISLPRTSNRGGGVHLVSRYFPLITVEFDYNNQKHLTPVKLSNEGYRSPEDAFNKVLSIIPDKKIKYEQSFRESIDPQYESYLKNLRLDENTDNNHFFSFFVNPKKPLENEYLYKNYKLSDWLGSALLFLIGLILVAVPLFFFKAVPFNTRINGMITSFIGSVILYSSLTIVIFPWMCEIFNFQKPGEITPPIFEVIIDGNYDGSQLEPYLQKPDTSEN
jgi:hypothetical protein